MAYSPYQHYKQSGVNTIGLIPQHWSARRLKFMARIQNGKDYKEVVSDEGFPVIGSGGEFAKANSYLYNGESVLLGRKGTIDRPLYINGPFWTVDTMFYTEVSSDISAKYLFYCALTINFLKYATSTALPSMTQQDLGAIPFAAPDHEEQKAIARFLDFKTAQIDALIAKKKALLDKLAEKRTALISHAVTKGLDPSVPMKNSGVAWLGDIPAHWQRMLMVRVISKFEQGWSPSCDEREASLDEWGVLKSGCVNYGVFQEQEHKTLPPSIDPIPSLEVKAGDILMCRASGSKHLIGSVAMVRKCRSKLIFSDKTYRITLQPNLINSEFFVLLMKSKYVRDQIELSISGADGLANNIPQSSVKAYQIVLPSSVDEQKAISTLLNKKSESIETQEVKIVEAIGRLQEYRAALITNSVTGKIDVRGFEIPQPAEGITS
jgi:type I restriction enzyme S subunit